MKSWRPTQAHRYRSGLRESRRQVMMVMTLVILGICLGVGVVGFFAYRGLARWDFFQITSIRIDGCRRISKEQVLAWSGVDIHTNLLAMDTDEVRRRLEEQGWVARAEVERQWPNLLRIRVVERKPLALVNLADGLRYADRRGDLFAAALPPEDMDFPVVSGVAGTAEEQKGDGEPLRQALSFIHHAGPANSILPRQNISEVHVATDGDLILFLADRPFPIYLGKERLQTKYYQLAKVLRWLYTHKKFDSTVRIRMDYLGDKVLVTTADAG